MKKNNVNKRIISLLLVLAALLGCLAGCAEVQDPGDDTPGSAASSTPSTEGSEQVVIDAKAQEAVVQTALAYLARSTRIQYDDTRLNADTPNGADVLYRWQVNRYLCPSALCFLTKGSKKTSLFLKNFCNPLVTFILPPVLSMFG